MLNGLFFSHFLKHDYVAPYYSYISSNPTLPPSLPLSLPTSPTTLHPTLPQASPPSPKPPPGLGANTRYCLPLFPRRALLLLCRLSILTLRKLLFLRTALPFCEKNCDEENKSWSVKTVDLREEGYLSFPSFSSPRATAKATDDLLRWGR